VWNQGAADHDSLRRKLQMNKQDALKSAMLRNAATIRELQSAVYETVKYREKSPAQRKEWENACAEFHARYDGLAFPYDYKATVSGLEAGDPDVIEAVLCFLECRPYFFRSGYMFKSMMRKCKRASLAEAQASRLKAVTERQAMWKRERSRRTGYKDENDDAS
jgi:hypothetical protein